MKFFKYYICLFSLALTFSKCSKDKGNYNYAEINDISIGGLMPSTNPVKVFFNDSLHIRPELTFASGTPEPQGYTYEWTMAAPGTNKPPVIATTKELHLLANQTPGAYELIYRIKDNKTGVQYQHKGYATIISEVYEGYFVLSEVNDKSRLDMLSWLDGGFTQITDVLKKMKSTLPEQGQPYQVLSVGSNTRGYDIWLLTASGTTRLDPESFDISATSDIRYLMLGDLPADFKAKKMMASYSAGRNAYLWAMTDDAVYASRQGLPFQLPLNTYVDSATLFKPGSSMTNDDSYATLYNWGQRRFVNNDASFTICTNAAATYPTGLDLVFMGKIPAVVTNTADQAFAILKDPVSAKFQFLKFANRFAPSINTSIDNAPDFDKATHFAVSPEFNYLFYSVAGKLYEYDLALKTTKLMLDKGNEIITMISFQQFFTLRVVSNSNYSEWGKWLSVASYDPGGTAGINGTLAQYKVPAVNGDLIEQKKWTGFGKIVSTSFRER